MTIDFLWNSVNEDDWNNQLLKYTNLIKPQNLELEKELDCLNADLIKAMPVNEFYNFLYDKYFVWKYTSPKRLLTTRRCLEQYKQDDNILELESIQNLIFRYNLNNISNCLNNARRIKGLGIAGASGLLSLLFPKYFGTVDHFVVKRLLEISNLKEHDVLTKINPECISLNYGVLLIQIMRDKAAELNKKFESDKWTPRKIDKILWCIDR